MAHDGAADARLCVLLDAIVGQDGVTARDDLADAPHLPTLSLLAAAALGRPEDVRRLIAASAAGA